MKIAVYAICKNEEHNVNEFLKNVRDADEVVICDTGSTDKTVPRLEFLNNGTNLQIHHILVQPWSFATARNTSLALVSDVDVCIRLDLDERLPPNWREKLEDQGPFEGKVWYDYQFSPGFAYEYCVHVHPRHNVWWRGIDHESLEFEHQCPYRKIDFKITHHPLVGRSTANILPRLERAVRLEPSARAWWYLGREYYYHGQWAKCITAFFNYLNWGSWDVEIMAARIMMAKSAKALGLQDEAVSHAIKAVDAYRTRESYICWSEVSDDPTFAEHMARYAWTFTNKTETIFQRPELWTTKHST